MLAIGIPTYKNLKYLEKCIATIKTKYPFKVCVVDNSPDEEVQNWLAEGPFIKRDEEFVFVENIRNTENKGVAGSWNQIIHWGLSFEKTKALFILNNDIELHPEAINRMYESLTVHDFQAITGLNLGNHPDQLDVFNPPQERWTTNYMDYCCFALTPRTIKRVGLFDENFKVGYFEDNDYQLRIVEENIIFSQDRWAAFIHYGSRTIKEAGLKHEPYFTNNRRYFFKKWGFLP